MVVKPVVLLDDASAESLADAKVENLDYSTVVHWVDVKVESMVDGMVDN